MTAPNLAPTRPAVRRRPGTPGVGTGEVSTALSISAGWVINAAVAEWIIRRPGPGRLRSAAVGGPR